MCNAGEWDRVLRIIVGVALIMMALAGNVWGWLGLIMIVTGFTGFCPLYSIVGIKTGCKDGKAYF